MIVNVALLPTVSDGRIIRNCQLALSTHDLKLHFSSLLMSLMGLGTWMPFSSLSLSPQLSFSAVSTASGSEEATWLFKPIILEHWYLTSGQTCRIRLQLQLVLELLDDLIQGRVDGPGHGDGPYPLVVDGLRHCFPTDRHGAIGILARKLRHSFTNTRGIIGDTTPKMKPNQQSRIRATPLSEIGTLSIFLCEKSWVILECPFQHSTCVFPVSTLHCMNIGASSIHSHYIKRRAIMRG